LAPAAFTLAWVAAAAVQPSYSPRHADVSTLASADAAHPWIAMAGMAVTGALVAAFGATLRPPRWPALLAPLVALAGASVVAVGSLRIDCSEQLSAACRSRSAAGLLSWHDRAHNLATVVALVSLVTAMVVVAARPESGRPGLRPFTVAACVLTVAIFAVYRAQLLPGWGGALERAAAYLPLLWVAALGALSLRGIPAREPPPYTERSASVGESRAARRAG